MKARLICAAQVVITIPSISMWGLFCISSRSLKVPGSDSSALHTRYLSMSPWGRNEAFRPIGKPAPPRPRMSESMMFGERLLGGHRQRLAQGLVAAAALVYLEGVQPGLVDAVEQQLHSLGSCPSASCRGQISARADAGVGARAVSELLVLEDRAVGFQVLDDQLRILGRQWADVLAVDRRHRRDVAPPEALERPHVDPAGFLCRGDHRLIELVGAAAASTRCWCTRIRRPSVSARSRTCRRRSPPSSGRRG